MPDPGQASEPHWAEIRSKHGGVDEIPLPQGVPGRLWLCGKRFIGPDPEAAVGYVGADAVVCLNEPHELDRYPGYVEWLKTQPEGRVLWLPIPDLHAPTGEAALNLFDELQRRLDAGQRLLVHCGGGIGRAGTVAAGLLVTLGETPADAVSHIRAHRPLGGPEAGAQTELLEWLHDRRSPAGHDNLPAIREADPSEWPALRELEIEADRLFDQVGIGPFDMSEEDDHFARAAVVLVAGRPAEGFACVEEVDGFAHLWQVSVHPSSARRGIGRSLVRAVCDWAASNGFPGVTLTTYRDVPWNGPFYETLGFTVLDDLSPGLEAIRAHEREIGDDDFSPRVAMIRYSKEA